MSYFNQDVLQQFAINLNVEALLSKDLFNNPILQKKLDILKAKWDQWLIITVTSCFLNRKYAFLILHTTDAKIASM